MIVEKGRTERQRLETERERERERERLTYGEKKETDKRDDDKGLTTHVERWNARQRHIQTDLQTVREIQTRREGKYEF